MFFNKALDFTLLSKMQKIGRHVRVRGLHLYFGANWSEEPITSGVMSIDANHELLHSAVKSLCISLLLARAACWYMRPKLTSLFYKQFLLLLHQMCPDFSSPSLFPLSLDDISCFPACCVHSPSSNWFTRGTETFIFLCLCLQNTS